MADKTRSLYNDEVTLDFTSDPHGYFWKEIGLPVRGFSSIKDRLGVNHAIANWMVNQAIEHIKDNVVRPAAAAIIIDRERFGAICHEAKTASRKTASKAANIGTIVHKFAERVLVDGSAEMPSEPQAAKGAAAFLGWLRSHKVDPIDTERMVLSRKHYYAGTVDFYGLIDFERCVLDFKTSSGFYVEMPLQLAAYAIALEEELGVKIKKGLIVRLDKKTGVPKVYTVALESPDDDDTWKDAFISLAHLDRMMTRLETHVDGIRARAA